MREIVRSENSFGHQQFAGIEWQTADIFNYSILLFENSNTITPLTFNENIEWLYKKWLIGDIVEFTIPTKIINWNVKETFVPEILGIQEKNEYLARKVQKTIQLDCSTKQKEFFENTIANLLNKLNSTTSNNEHDAVFEEAKKLDDAIKQAVAKTRNITLEQKWVEDGIFNEDYLELKPKLNAVFETLNQLKANAFYENYNTISPKVEAAYVQAKADENFNTTRKDLIALQKEVINIPLERWQKNELMDRLRAAFDFINSRQDEWRTNEDAKREAHTIELQKQFDETIPKALNSTFNEAFTRLKNLQDIMNKSSIQREKRATFYTALDQAFTTIKEKADSENELNYALANKQIEVAILSSANTDLFKDARAILMDAQNDLKEIRLSKKQKDELFGKLREAFDKLNAEQDAYFASRKKENKNKLEDLLVSLKRNLSRKKEGIENLYQAKSNVEAKASIIKVDKKSDGSIANQFKERLFEITAKVEEAEKEIIQLQNKIDKLEGELKGLSTQE